MALYFRFSIFGVMILLGPHVPAVAASFDPKLEISIDANDDEAENAPKICKLLGDGLKTGGGPFGSGFFSSYRCVEKNSENEATASKDLWRLHVGQEDSRVAIKISYRDRLQAQVTFLALRERYKLLIKEDFRFFLLNALLDQLPARWRFTEGADEKSIVLKIKKSDASKWPDPPLSPVLLLYELKEQEDYFAIEPLAEAKQKETSTLIGYQTKKAHLRDKKAFFAHNELGRGSQCAAFQQQMDAIVAQAAKDESFVENLLDKIISSYIGLRFGTSISSDANTKKTMFFGLLVELRSGKVSGLNYSYDKIPEVKSKTASGEELIFGSSHHLLGYSISKSLGTSTALDVRPRVGVMTVNATLEKSPTETFRFGMPIGSSFGLSLGFQVKKSIFATRLSGAYDYVVGILDDSEKSDGTIGYTSYGIDLFVDGSKSEATKKIAYLVFVNSAQAALLITTPLGDTSSAQYTTMFAGGGLMLTW